MSQSAFLLSIAFAFSVAITALIAGLANLNGRTTRALVLAATTVPIAASGFAVLENNLRVNLTPSMPVGIYQLEPLPTSRIERGMFVAVCAPPDAAELGRRRGYLSRGLCPHDTEPLLKAVVGVASDGIQVSAQGVAVNGCLLPDSQPLLVDRAGRTLPSWARLHYRLSRAQIWLYADNARSWDSRYWGPGRAADVVADAVPMLVVPGFGGVPRIKSALCACFVAFFYSIMPQHASQDRCRSRSSLRQAPSTGDRLHAL